MKLTGEQINELAEFADGADVVITWSSKFFAIWGNNELVRWVNVRREEDDEKVRIYDTGQIERIE